MGVGHDEHLRGAGGHVDGHCARDELFGLGHVAVTGAEYLVDARNALRAVGHGGDSLCATDTVDVLDAADVGGIEYLGRDVASGALRGAEHHFPTACDAGGQAEHQNRGEEWGATAGNVKTHAADGHGALDAAHAGGGADVDGMGLLGGMEGGDVLGRHGYGAFDFGTDGLGSGTAFSGRHFECCQCGAVEALGIVAQRGIAL